MGFGHNCSNSTNKEAGKFTVEFFKVEFKFIFIVSSIISVLITLRIKKEYKIRTQKNALLEFS